MTGRDGDAFDVVVAGAGPAGSLTALLAARRGLSTLLVERAPFPRWKVCGACLNRAGVHLLQEVGVGHIPDAGHPLEALRISGWGRDVVLPVEGSVAVARAGMDAALQEAALAAGARHLQGSVVHAGTSDGHRRAVALRVDGEERTVRARVVVAATGLQELREGDEGAPGPAPGTGSTRVIPGSRIGVGAILPSTVPDYPPGSIHMVAGRAGYTGLVRDETGALTVAGALDPDWIRDHGGPASAVEAHLLAAGAPPLGAEPLAGWQGTPPLTRRPAAVAAPGLFRVGDAAGYVEPFTGEGMAWALGGALHLAPLLERAVRGWDPALAREWTRLHRRHVVRRQRLCRWIARLSRLPLPATAVLALLEFLPGLARPFAARTAQPFPLPGAALP